MEKPVVLTDFFRSRLSGILNGVAGFLLRLGLSPDVVTLAGLGGHLAAAVLIVNEQMLLAGLVLLVFAPLDSLDGTMARLRGQPAPFGAFFDSVIDRYSELILWGGVMTFCVLRQDSLGCLAVFAAAAGSIMVSYTRARAEGIGLSTRIGLLSRLERYLILVPALILSQPLWAAWIIAILANFTALQRILFVRKESSWKKQ